MRHLLIAVFFLVFLLLWSAPTVVAPFSEAGVQKLRVAVDAPDFTLKELGGKNLSQRAARKDHSIKFFRDPLPELPEGISFFSQTS